MKDTADEHDPDWPKYPETILRFSTAPPVTIDLREVVGADDLAALRRIGFEEPFAVMTAYDPRGENLSSEENVKLAAKLERRLRAMGYSFTAVDACSSDGEHCECSVAVKMPQRTAVEIGREFEQVAIFWFDGARFWIVGALVRTGPLMLPRSS